MNQAFLVRHWQGKDSVERVVSEQLLLADNVVEALLTCVPFENVEDWRLDSLIWDYASLTNTTVQLDAADYWEAELIENPMQTSPAEEHGEHIVLN